MKPMNLRLVKAVSFATWAYSLLFLLYLVARLTLNSDHVHLNDLFIDRIPFFTFLTTGISLVAINLVFLAIYLETRNVQTGRGRSDSIDAEGPIPMQQRGYWPKQKRAGLQGISDSIGISYLNLRVWVMWFFSLSIWLYLTYLTLANPPSPPYWPISLIMFVISYICMVLIVKDKDSLDAARTA